MKPTNDLNIGDRGLPGEITGLSGSVPSGKIVVIASRYNAVVCDALATAAVKTLVSAGVNPDHVEVVRVPGAWELPLAVAHAFTHPDTIAAIALGVVIQGDTSHDEHINRSVSMALMQLGVETKKPIGFGLLTCYTAEQAADRAGGKVGNKGIECAEAVVEMLRLAANTQ